MASFRRFADLPKEIRDVIWSDASQRDLAGVQIFELRTPKPKEDDETSDTTASGTRPPRHQLDAPLRSKCFPALDGSPGTSNVSRYMADIGLWTACKESREVMEKTTQRSQKILEMQAKDKYRYYHWEEHVPAIISCSTSQPFLVQPHTDLFVIQPSKIEDIDWWQVASDIRKQFEPRDFAFEINIGIEWKAEWGIKQEDGDFNLLCEAFRDINAQLWVIDTNLKRKEDMNKNTNDRCRKVFYACDRKFFEVDFEYKPLERWRHIIPPPEETRFGSRHPVQQSILYWNYRSFKYSSMAGFERFSELPRELRDQIWSMAIRDDRPGVHIFGQYDETKRCKTGGRFLRSGDMVSGTWAEPSCRRYFGNLSEDRSDENISAYLIDGGLWTACHESRLIMDKRYEQSKRKHCVEDTYPRHDRTKEGFKKATTGCFDERKKDAPAFKEKAGNGYEINALYASDRRLLEIDCHNWRDLEKEWEYIKPMEGKSDDGFSSSPDFLWGLDLELRDKALPDSGHYREPYCGIGILGWDELNLERSEIDNRHNDTPNSTSLQVATVTNLTSHRTPIMVNFSELPREIRDMIWPLVLRDNHPGVHIFRHYDEKKEFMTEGRSLMYGNLLSDILSEPSPDKYFPSLDKDRKNENMSTYLIDGAMWNTCKESRLIIEKYFSQYKWSAEEWWRSARSDSRGWDEYPFHSVFKVPSTECFEGGSPSYLTVFPRKDLFVFQPDKLDGMDWSSFARRLTKGDTRPAFQRLQHIAIEYDPEWWGVTHRWNVPMVYQLEEAAFALKDIQKLWFIDHNLKRKKNTPAFDETWDRWESPNAFYARDRKFLEIDWRNFGALEDWEYVMPVDRSDILGNSSVGLARQLNDYIRSSSTRLEGPRRYCESDFLDGMNFDFLI
ncbi:hypothetical protein CEK26_002585 [Fusarium fujikuroi]|nr:hypothetical protein CEK26_002585 [Fusarium fujikuroi]